MRAAKAFVVSAAFGGIAWLFGGHLWLVISLVFGAVWSVGDFE
ncbi:hypothetical protein [Methylocapsa sp. S129]|nr:hypothetical protein [Methylocapsa sp. S129]